MDRVVESALPAAIGHAGGGLVFLVGAARHDLQRIIRRRPLQRLCFIPRRRSSTRRIPPTW